MALGNPDRPRKIPKGPKIALGNPDRPDNLRRLPLRHKSQESCLIRISQDARSHETGCQGENPVSNFRHRLRIILVASAEDAADLPSENLLMVPPAHA